MAEQTEQHHFAAAGSTKELVEKGNEVAASIFRQRFVILKNIIVISLSFLLLFTAFQSLSNLQSSVNREKGLGLASLSIIYASLVISCTLLPTLVITRLGCKWTIVVSMLMYSLYMLANFYASWYTLVPASIILGTAAAPLWTAKCRYLTIIAGDYARLEGVTTEAIINRFFGIFFLLFQSSQIWGNLISSSVFKTAAPNETVPSDIVSAHCGVEYCPQSSKNYTNTNLEPPEDRQVMILMGIYFACAVAAAGLVAIVVDPLAIDEKRNKTEKLSLSEFLATAKHLQKPEQLLLIPLTIYSGIEQAFIAGDYTLAFITCSFGVYMVGYTMITFGVTDATFSFFGGRLVQHVGRVPLFFLGFVAHLAAVLTLLLWRPDPEHLPVYFVVAALWGLGDAVWQTQINAFYGVIFPNTTAAAFSNYRLWESLGFLAAFAYSNFLCVRVKVYIVLTVLLVGMTGYSLVEIRRKFQRSKDEYVVNE